MTHRAHRGQASSNQASYRGIPIVTANAASRTVHCVVFNQQTPIPKAKEKYDPASPPCFACGGGAVPRHRCQH